MRAEKNYLIAEVETHLKKSDYVILANFSQVSVADVSELRNRLATESAEFHVVKNSSLRVAAKTLGLPEFEGALAGPTAVVVGGKNPAGVAKVLKKFFEDKKKLEVKVGVLDKKIVTASDLAKIADLPSFEALRSQLLGLFTQTGAAFVRVLDAKVKKESPDAPAAEQPAAPSA
ncbi:50S ribosomal protein L10 [Nibricoccus aquaticus]|uniref:Large ribosomal subunit protein uL10 n=1 Tax=Nibricoccus aquaticus TaxID=2576891 RepID=A0A290Q547_9BACT|nr:50S ribosomal protein L10 [Nibricoccus aquaticus]ATC63397.1 50S ribosomal protein L10 [Nibricoccus aquaticus]